MERVYAQLQAFFSDPLIKDDYQAQVELVKAFKRISNKCKPKFREECKNFKIYLHKFILKNSFFFKVILPYLTVITMQTMQAQHAPSAQLSEQRTSEMTMLLFDTYNVVSCCTISRQLVHESLLPGLNCLKQILHQDLSHHDKAKLIESIINEFEQKYGSHETQLGVSGSPSTTSIDSLAAASPQTSRQEHNYRPFNVFKSLTNSKDKFQSLLTSKKH